ncbi:MAG: hypothetical protein P8Y44_11610 [Acidobacteriota bacterium]
MSRTGDFSLVPLRCEACGTGMEAEGTDIVFYCPGCRNGFRFDPESHRMIPLQVDFVSVIDMEGVVFKPFWSIPATVHIEGRVANPAGFLGILSSLLERGASGMAVASTVFAVPAFKLDIRRAIELSRRYTTEPPEVGERLEVPLLGGCFDFDDAHKIVHYAVIATEVEKGDVLTDLKYRIEFGEPRLLAVPFVAEAGVWKDARYHLVV